MGIDLNGAQLLIKAHKNGVSFERMATLGRQGIVANRQALISVLRLMGYDTSKDRVRRHLDPTTNYSEGFFSLLGAKQIVAIDASDYEGAQIVHDMNQPIPESLVSSFDVVLDGGTLEHIFDFPTALRNAARMVRPNGRFISLTMANNFCGHGFYQFSPELFYRFFCPENGFAMESCIIWEDIHGSGFYRVPDPDSVRSRIDLTSGFGIYMFVMAKRLDDVSREFIPQQSDYARLWKGPEDAAQPSSRVAKWKPVLKRIRTILKRSQILRSAAGFVRNYRLRIRRNARGFLTPVKDLRVLR